MARRGQVTMVVLNARAMRKRQRRDARRPDGPTTGPKRLYRVAEAAPLLGMSPKKLRQLCLAGRVFSVVEGSMRLIPTTELDAYVRLLEQEARDVG